VRSCLERHIFRLGNEKYGYFFWLVYDENWRRYHNFNVWCWIQMLLMFSLHRVDNPFGWDAPIWNSDNFWSALPIPCEKKDDVLHALENKNACFWLSADLLVLKWHSLRCVWQWPWGPWDHGATYPPPTNCTLKWPWVVLVWYIMVS